MAQANGRAISYRKVPLDKIIVDREYQRPLNVARVDGMVLAHDDHLLQAPELSLRPDGRYACFEGQHRIAMERKRGTTHMLCRVHEGLTEEEEAHYFAKFQLNRRGLRPYDRWRAQLRAGEPTQVEIDKVVRSWGYKVANSGGVDKPRNITAVTALEQVYARGGAPHLDDVIGFIAELWDGDEATTNSPMLLGASAFLMAFGDKVGDVQRKHLRRHSPIVVLRRAVTHGHPQTASAEGVALELRKMAKMTRAHPVRYTKTFGAPPKPAKKPAATRKPKATA